MSQRACLPRMLMKIKTDKITSGFTFLQFQEKMQDISKFQTYGQ
jgi:hypothetical protein